MATASSGAALVPLAQIVRDIARRSAELSTLDDRIGHAIREIEDRLRQRGCLRVAWVRLPDGSELAWSGAMRGRVTRGVPAADRWRFLIRDIDGHVVDLRSSSREERCEVFATGAMERLVDALVVELGR